MLMKREGSRRAARFWRNWIKPLLIAVIVCTSFRSAVADWNDVPTGSMKPTILEGDRILVNKLAFDLKLPYTTWHLWRWGQPARGDVVVCYSPANGDRLVKRVMAIGGDSVELRNNRVLVNGQAAEYGPLDEETIGQIPPDEQSRHVFASEAIDGNAHAVMATPAVPAQRTFGPVVVPEGHFFVMGDNRDASLDSRVFGCVPREQILGRCRRLAFSVDRSRHYLPRWERTLRRVR